MFRLVSASLFLLLFISSASTVAADRWGLNIFGLSYHFDPFDTQGNRLNGINPGVGLHYVLRENEHNIFMLDSGIYYSSKRDAARFGSFAWQRKIGVFRIGPAVAFFDSASYNRGNPFLAPLLLISFRLQTFSFNFVPIPRYKDRNRNAAVGFFATWHFS